MLGHRRPRAGLVLLLVLLLVLASTLVVEMREMGEMGMMRGWRWRTTPDGLSFYVAGLDKGLEELLAEWDEGGGQVEVLDEGAAVDGGMLLFEVGKERSQMAQLVLRNAVRGLVLPSTMLGRLASHFSV
jgi:hypothetical protein